MWHSRTLVSSLKLSDFYSSRQNVIQGFLPTQSACTIPGEIPNHQQHLLLLWSPQGNLSTRVILYFLDFFPPWLSTYELSMPRSVPLVVRNHHFPGPPPVSPEESGCHHRGKPGTRKTNSKNSPWKKAFSIGIRSLPTIHFQELC